MAAVCQQPMARERIHDSVVACSRRRFICAAAAAAVVAPALGLAQLPKKVFRIGYLNLRSGPNSSDEAFIQRLRELGYEVDRNIIMEYRWAENDLARLEQQADELVRLNVDVIVTAVTPAVQAAKKATSTIPIVMAAAADPVSAGLITSLAHPGGNLTGFSFLTNDLAAKRLQLLREIVPGAARVAVLTWGAVQGSGSPSEQLVAQTVAAGQQLGFEISHVSIGDSADVSIALEAMARTRPQALIVQVSSLTYEHRGAIVDAARRMHLPDMYETRLMVEAGGLVSYGPDVDELYRGAATYVGKILRGARPDDLPVEQPTKFELVLNLEAAKSRGIAIPPTLLRRADKVIR